MTAGQFEGDVSQISTRQIEFISDILNKKGFSDSKVTIKPVGVAGDNYIANVIRITAEKGDETFKIVAKVAPKIEKMRSALKTRLIFLNEHLMYNEVLPIFTKLEKAAGIPDNERFRYAACYGNLMEDCEEMILLEDLSVSNFVMLDRFKPLNDGEVKLILKSFARLHSMSYALKYQQPEVYEEFKNKFFDTWDDDSMVEQMSVLLGIFENECIAVCDPKYKDNIKGTGSRMLESAKKLQSFDLNSRFSVIQQGDAWTNNILFKLQDGKAESCCMIDYQISKVTSPVADLHYMFFNCTDHENRKKHLYEWLDYYHKELGDSLSEFGLKVNYVYPRDQLDADLKRHTKYAVAIAFMVTSAISREAAAAQKLKTAMENASEDNMDDMASAFFSLSSLDDKTVKTIKTRIEGIIDTCLHFGLL